MAISKVERLLNLVIALLSTSQFLTAERIRESVAGYADSPGDDAFSRMFERDKNELRELGIPLETGSSPGNHGVEGYRIDRNAYELPDIDFTSAEAAAVAVAVQLWESPELVATTQSALLKLRAGGVLVDSETPVAVTAVPSRTRGSEPVLRVLLAAVDAGQAVRFRHRSAPNAPEAWREVEPWGVVTDRGRWYLVGYDRDRKAPRTFRLSRIGDDIAAFGPAGAFSKPAGVDLRATVDRFTEPAAITGTATVWVAKQRANDIRRLGRVFEARRLTGRDGDIVEIPIRSLDWLVRVISGHGPDALVLEPPELRAAVIGRLTDVLESVTEAVR